MGLWRDTDRSGSAGAVTMWVVLVAATLGVTVWANLWKDSLRAARVVVEGNKTVHTEEILAAAGIPPEQKLFEADLHAIQQRVGRNNFLRSVWVRREAPDRVVIEVTERIPLVAVLVGETFYLDAEGTILPPVPAENIFDVPVLTGAISVNELLPGKHISSDIVQEALSAVQMAQRIDDQLYRRISEIHIDGKNDLTMYTAEAGVPVLIGHGNIARKLVKFDGFWRQYLDQRGAGELQYIDLRFDDQVVVKWKPEASKERDISVLYRPRAADHRFIC